MKILMSLIFYPRGGSAQVARYLSRALMDLGHEVHLISGTLRDGDPQHDAESFFHGIPKTLVDYTEAWRGFRAGENPISDHWSVPFHPSYEDKPDVPDRVFFKITESEYEALLRSWTGVFEAVRSDFTPEVIHLHHLTHAHTAACLTFPEIPRLTQLHGTELKMLETLDALNHSEEGLHDHGTLARRMISDAVEASDHFAAISPDIRDRGVHHLGIDRGRITTLPNGVDTSLFRPRGWPEEERWSFLQKILVEEPQGWDESGTPGSVRYARVDAEKLKDRSGRLKPLAIFVGRFLGFKRVDLLLKAVHEINQRFEDGEDLPFNLLVWGGMPGEWEGEHPYSLAQALRLPNVFFCGWLPHDILSQGLVLADVLVAPSFNEPFGQVYLEAMATGIPVIATRSGGPLDFVVGTGPQANGWVCEVDDQESLAEVLFQALTEVEERQRRGSNALALVKREYEWMEIARRYAQLYRRMVE